MNMRKTSNPVITSVKNEQRHSGAASYVTGETATFSGIATKTGILLAIIVGISAFIWISIEQIANVIMPLFLVSSIAGFIFVILAQTTQAKALFTCLYAVSEGIIIGTLTVLIQSMFPDTPIVLNAAIITFSIVAFLLVAYSTGLFKVGFTFRKIVYTLLFTVVIASFLMMILSLFGMNLLSGLPIGVLIAISVGMILLASFMLMIDFDDSKRAVDAGVPKKYEWTLSLGILVSLVWLYVEVLRLLVLLASRIRND